MRFLYGPGRLWGGAACELGAKKYCRAKNRLLTAAAIITGLATGPAALAQGQPAVQSPPAGQSGTQQPAQSAQPADCTPPIDPYKNYACLDAYLGDDPFSRFFNYYKLEWGQGSAPSDPNAPASAATAGRRRLKQRRRCPIRNFPPAPAPLLA